VVVARDPYWLYAFWEITEPTFETVREQLGDDLDGSRAILRVHSIPSTDEASAQPAGFFDLEIDQTAVSWYIHAGIANRSYRVDLGLLTPAGTFFPLVTSNLVTTPPDTASEQPASESDVPAETQQALSAPTVGRGSEPRHLRSEWDGDSEEDVQRARDEWPEPRAAARTFPSRETGPSDRATSPRGGWESPAGTEPGQREIGPAGDRPSSPRGERFQRGEPARYFRFVLNTELVVYGATEPDASLTVQGRPVQLRPDGTFTLRFALPDGEYSVPVIAVSHDGISTREITPTVRRATQTQRFDRPPTPASGVTDDMQPDE